MQAAPASQPPLDDLFRKIGARWLTLLVFTLAGVALGAAAAFVPKPLYRAQALLAPAEDDLIGANLSSLAGGVGGLAALVGLSPGTGARQNEAVLIMRSRSFAAEFVQENKLLPVLYSDQWDAARARWTGRFAEKPPTFAQGAETFIDDLLRVEQDPKTNTVRLSIVWHDPQVAADLANRYAVKLNQKIRLREIAEATKALEYLEREVQSTKVLETQAVLYRLTEAQLQRATLANVRRDFVFRIIDMANAPELHEIYRPQRVLLVSFGALAGLGLGVFVALLAIARRRPHASLE